MEAELGWSRSATTGAFSLALVTQGAIAVSVGRWLDRHNSRWLLTAGSAAAALGVLAWSAIDSIVAFYVLWAFLGVAMATVLYEAAFTVVAKWFDRSRVRALTFVTLAAGFASTIFLPVHDHLIATYGWRRALAILAVALAVICVPLHAIVLRAPPGTSGPAHRARRGLAVRAVLALPAFPAVLAAFVTSSFVASALAVHQVALLAESGHTTAFAAGATGALGAMQVPGRLLFAPVRRWFGNTVATGVVFAAFALGVGILAVGTGTATVIVFVTVYGMARGMTTLLRASLIGDLYGTADYGAITGVIAAAGTAATALGPLAVAAVHDRTGSYDLARWALVVIALVAFGASTRIGVNRATAPPATAHRGR